MLNGVGMPANRTTLLSQDIPRVACSVGYLYLFLIHVTQANFSLAIKPRQALVHGLAFTSQAAPPPHLVILFIIKIISRSASSRTKKMQQCLWNVGEMAEKSRERVALAEDLV